MVNSTIFYIDGQEFKTTVDFDTLDGFTVQSIPKPYDVVFDNNKEPCIMVNQLMHENSNNLLLIDRKVFNLYFKDRIHIDENRIYFAEATEEFKTIKGVLDVVDFLNDKSFSKGEKLIVVGGGIIEDVGAFASACYKRGISWIYFPTTLLSMSDSCIGGKTGINHKNAKNQLALFSAPSRVIINIDFLFTLESGDIKSGLGEILKLCITGGGDFLKTYSSAVQKGEVANEQNYKKAILASLVVKKAIVEEDEFELNLRRSLNYGHTIGHAVEIMSGYKIPHGIGVSVGMIVENILAVNRSILGSDECKRLNEITYHLLDEKTRSLVKSIDVDGLEILLKKDKKTLTSKAVFTFFKSAGNMIFMPVTIDSALIDEIKIIFETAF